MPDFSKIAAAAAYSIERFGFLTQQSETVVTVTTSPLRWVKHDPDRLALFLVLEGTNPVNVGRDSAVSTTSGLPMPSQYDGLSWIPETDGVGTTYERWMIANGGTSVVRIIETRRVTSKFAAEKVT